MRKYLTEEEFRNIKGPFCLTDVREEEIEGWPSLVVYIAGQDRGLVLTPKLVDEFVKVLGPNPEVERFFRRH